MVPKQALVHKDQQFRRCKQRKETARLLLNAPCFQIPEEEFLGHAVAEKESENSRTRLASSPCLLDEDDPDIDKNYLG